MNKSDAIDNAARNLRNLENSYQRTYGGTSQIALDLAKAWTELARVIGDSTNSGSGVES